MERTLFVCQCGSIDHQFVVTYDEEEPSNDCVYISVHLTKLPLLKRLKHAIRYVLGKSSVYGDFEEVILDQDQIKTLINKLVYSYLQIKDSTRRKTGTR